MTAPERGELRAERFIVGRQRTPTAPAIPDDGDHGARRLANPGMGVELLLARDSCRADQQRSRVAAGVVLRGVLGVVVDLSLIHI